MKLRIATFALLAATAGSASANGSDVLAGVVVGAIVGSQVGSHTHSSVSVHYGGYAPPVVVAPAPVIGYAPPPPPYGYAHPYVPPTVVYPAPPVHYAPPPAYWRHHHRHFDHGYRQHRGHGGDGWRHR